MKKILAASLIIFLSAVFSFSQSETPTADWQTFAPAKRDFTVEIPIALKASAATNANSSDRFGNVFDGTYFFIFSDNPKNTFQYNRVMDFVKTLRQTGTTERAGEFEIEKFAFADDEDFYHTILTAKGKNRVYVFQTVSPSKNDAAAERFFASLKLNESGVPENSVSTPETPLPAATQRVDEKADANAGLVPGKLEMTVEKIGGSGRSGTDETGTTTQTETKPLPVPSNSTAGVKILSKPRANYTDFARFYQITGKVVLRVTFSADGSIGAVTPVTKQPFGLTAQAIQAAKGIRFEPAMKDGVAYSVTKPVEYSFIIY
jgi:hypothetical protein